MSGTNTLTTFTLQNLIYVLRVICYMTALDFEERNHMNMFVKIATSTFTVFCLVIFPVLPTEAIALPTARINNETGIRRSSTLARQHFNQQVFVAGVNQNRSNTLRIRAAGTNPALGTDIGTTHNIPPGRTNTTGQTNRLRGCLIPGSRTNWWAEARSTNGVFRATGTATLHRLP
ncbi:MAG: hypothetical protein FWC86_06230 [Coriobacteriia bacterium]|nr:hypothetical protein [Coriobacteriia bacterium]